MLRAWLPTSALELSFTEMTYSDTIVRTSYHFVETQPILPGRRSCRCSYLLSDDASSYALSKAVYYSLHGPSLLVSDNGVPVAADVVPADDKGSIRFEDFVLIEGVASPSVEHGPWSAIVLGVIGLALLIFLVQPLFQPSAGAVLKGGA
jgi:hypothetical protein